MTRHGKAMGALFALVLAGCGATSEEVQNEDSVEEAAAVSEEPAAPVAGPEQFGASLSPELPATEEAFRRMMSEPLLLSEPSEDPVTKVLLERQIEKSKTLAAAYNDSSTRAEQANAHLTELVAFREGQLFLRFGCSVARSAIPAPLAEDQRAKYQILLAEQAQSIFASVDAAFDGVPQWTHEELASHVTVIREAHPQSPEQVATYCQTTEPYWLHPAPRTVEATLSEACENGDGAMCWVWGTIGQGGQDAVMQACTLGYQAACGEPAADAPAGAPLRHSPSELQPAPN